MRFARTSTTIRERTTTNAITAKHSARGRLREILHSRQSQIDAGQSEQDGVPVRSWKLMIDGGWTVPAVEFEKGQPDRTVLLLADAGRASLADEAARLLEDNCRVIALDPFYFGESKIAKRDFLYALLVAAVGERPLGIQAGQVAAAARWCAGQRKTEPVTIVTHGPRTSLIALTAAAIEPQHVAGVQLHGSLGSLKEVIEQNMAVNRKPSCSASVCWSILIFGTSPLLSHRAPSPWCNEVVIAHFLGGREYSVCLEYESEYITRLWFHGHSYRTRKSVGPSPGGGSSSRGRSKRIWRPARWCWPETRCLPPDRLARRTTPFL